MPQSQCAALAVSSVCGRSTRDLDPDLDLDSPKAFDVRQASRTDEDTGFYTRDGALWRALYCDEEQYPSRVGAIAES